MGHIVQCNNGDILTAFFRNSKLKRECIHG
jgi:hypothetical protein